MRAGVAVHRFAVCLAFAVGLLVALGAAIRVAPAAADTGDIVAPSNPDDPQVDSGWQAGTCNSDAPEKCSVATPKQFFEQAGGHPQVGFTQIIVKHKAPGETPVGELKTVRVDLPVGLSVNPQATEQCPQATFEANPSSCPAGSTVGRSEVTASLLGAPVGPLNSTVYNIVPTFGEAARFGFELAGNDVYLRANVAWDGDYHEGFTIDIPEAVRLEPLIEGLILKNRFVFDGRAGNGTFITTPTTCFGPAVPPREHVYSTYLRADSYQIPNPSFPSGSSFFESRIPPGTSPKECSSIPFDPSIGVAPDTGQTDSPSGPSVEVRVPFEVPTAAEEAQPLTRQASSQVRRATVTLPPGMGLNPSAAGGGLQTCHDMLFGPSTRNPVLCPPGSKIGTVSIDTPPLPDGSLTGNVYVGRQLSRDPQSGNEYRIFVDAESDRYGISVRLEGKVSADPVTGRLTTTFDNEELGGLPQVPFSSFRLDFDGGPRAVLTSPPTCGPNRTGTELTPWSGNAAAHPADQFTLTDAPGGGACAATAASRPFAPGFAVHVDNPQAGAYSPLGVDVTRSGGSQELKGVAVNLPPGASARLAGLSYCPEAALAAAAASSGVGEASAPSCPASSFLGSASVTAGSGPAPIQIAGKVFLAGPYKGAPLSLAVVTPATAGPFDLGTVVVRVALFVDPETARVSAVSDPLPHVFGGALLDLGSISVRTDRPNFSLNPTNCAPMSAAATLAGGGGDPGNPAAFSSAAASSFFQVHRCGALGFRPKLFLRLFGARRRAKNPKLRAILLARGGDANIARAAVTLPPGLILDQANLSKVCTRVQFAADACPRKSIYGYARAFTPLLDAPLQGPVYLRSSSHELPDLVADLRGQLHIVLDGRTDSVHGRIRNTFDALPDVPVSKFVFTLRGGRKGLLVNSRNLCRRKGGKRRHGKRAQASGVTPRRRHRRHRGKGIRALARFKAQSGKKRNLRPRLRLPCGKKKRHRARR
jgi:hypothetical protein